MLWRVVGALLLSTLAVFAQTQDRVEIKVFVVEAGTTVGIDGAELEMLWLGPRDADGNMAEDVQRGVTNPQGEFVFIGKGSSGMYRVSAKKAGYTFPELRIQATPAKRVYEMKLELERSPTLK